MLEQRVRNEERQSKLLNEQIVRLEERVREMKERRGESSQATKNSEINKLNQVRLRKD